MEGILDMINDKTKNSPIIIPLFLIAVAGIVIACMLSYEDFWSSYLGYMAFPTQKAHDWAYIAAALIPQVGQIVFGYSFIAGERKPWKILVVIFLHLIDTGTDVAFKAWGKSFGVWLLAIVESEAAFTLGSEVLLTASFTMAIDIFPAFVKQVGRFFGQITDALSGENGGGHDNSKGGGGFGNNGGNNHGKQENHGGGPRFEPRSMGGPMSSGKHEPMGRKARQDQSMNRNSGNHRSQPQQMGGRQPFNPGFDEDEFDGME